MKFQDIPNSWIILVLALSLVGMRFCGIDTWVTATLSMIIGYLTGVKLEQARKES